MPISIAALVISGTAIKECTGLWRGEGEDCCAPIGFDAPGATCDEDCCA